MLPTGAAQWAMNFKFEAPQSRADGTNFFGDSVPVMTFRNGVAVIPICGPMIYGAGFLEKGYGAVSHQDITDNIDAADSDKTVSSIVFHINTPGGTVSGTPELHARVAAIQKPKVAFVDELCASAGYWPASACDAIYATPSAQVGSIGTILTVTNFAEALKSMGVEINVFQSGDLKSAGAPYKPMQKNEAAHFQGMVDNLGKNFRSAVTSKRPQIPASAMQGQTFIGDDAMNAGLIDGVVMGLNQVIATIAKNPANARAMVSTSKTFPALVAELVSAGSSKSEAISAATKTHPAQHLAWLAHGGGNL
jgi:signal peptide peptidase SppA